MTNTSVGDSIQCDDGSWEFDEAVAERFDDHVRKSIPLYDRVQSQVAVLIDYFTNTETDQVVYDIGCATGETLKVIGKKYKRKENHDIELVGIDLKKEMIRKAREKLENHEIEAKLISTDVTDTVSLERASAILSLYTLSFIEEHDRKILFDRIHDSLRTGGGFIFVEKTRGSSSFHQDLFRDQYFDYKRNHYSDDEIITKARSLRGQLRPISTDEYVNMLTEAGFRENNIDVFFRYYFWTGFIVRKSG